ncbi:22231_t:CDS:2, partial [Gigaspora rosea]
ENELMKSHHEDGLEGHLDRNELTGNIDWLENDNDTMDYLYICKRFVLWEKVINFLNHYCKQKGFGYRKGQSKKSDGLEEAKKRTFLCKHAGIYKPNKLGDEIYEVTTFVDEYVGHNLDPQNVHFLSQYRKLSAEMLEDIRFWTTEGNLNATKQYRMLPVKNDAFDVLNSLLEKKTNNPEWVVEYQLDPVSRALSHLLFELEYVKLIKDYPLVASYLEHLYESKRSWAKCYTSSCFTAGIQSTSRVESVNRIIKRDLDGRCVSLSDLCASITQLLKDRQIHKEEQMSHSLLYHITQVDRNRKDINSEFSCETTCIDEIFDLPQASAITILNEVHDQLASIWE